MRRTFLGIIAILVLLGVGATDARANIIVANEASPITGTVDPEGSLFRWYYRISVEDGQVLSSGGSFTIFDFDGLVYDNAMFDTTEPAGWTFSTSLVGPLVGPPDDASEFNLTWSYTGTDIPTGDAVGGFSALSVYDFDAAVDGYFSAVGFLNGSEVQNNGALGDILVPEAPEIIDTVPEPASMLLLSTGLGAAAMIRRRRRNKA